MKLLFKICISNVDFHLKILKNYIKRKNTLKVKIKFISKIKNYFRKMSVWYYREFTLKQPLYVSNTWKENDLNFNQLYSPSKDKDILILI